MIIAYVDGGSRGNPASGIRDPDRDGDGSLIEELHASVGVATNNVAEYRGLLAALAWALEHGHAVLRVRSESELQMKRMRGESRVKNPGLQRLHADALYARASRPDG